MDLRQIKCFVALVEEGSITGAARRLNVVQPAVSMQLRKLEDEFGVVLFDRTARGVSLSQKAHGLYQICLQILEQVAAAGQVLRAQGGEIATSLTVGSLHSCGYSFMPEVLSGIIGSHPGWKVSSREGYNDTLLDQLAQGNMDVAVLSSVKQCERFPYQQLGTEALLLVGAPDSDLVGMRDISAAAVAQRRLVLSPRLRRRFESDFSRAGVELRPELEVETVSGVIGMLRHPGWFSLLPASALCGRGGTDFCAVPIGEPHLSRTLWAVQAPHRPMTEAVALFIRAVRRVLSQTRWCTVTPEPAGVPVARRLALGAAG